jgi:hypothetical protein
MVFFLLTDWMGWFFLSVLQRFTAQQATFTYSNDDNDNNYEKRLSTDTSFGAAHSGNHAFTAHWWSAARGQS